MSGSQVFISYTRKDIESARRLYRDLRNAGLTPWLDEESLLPGQNWKSAIKKVIRDSRHFIALLSSSSVEKRGYVQKELKDALDVLDEFPRTSIYVIPARLDNCKVDDEKLADLHYVDLFPDWDKGVEKIIKAVSLEKKVNLSGSVVRDNLESKPTHDFGLSNVGGISYKETWHCQVCRKPFPSYSSYYEHFESEHR
jgi:hypothetical protein